MIADLDKLGRVFDFLARQGYNIKAKLNKDSDINDEIDDGRNILHLLCYFAQSDQVLQMIEQNPRTPLLDDTDVVALVEQVLNMGAEINAKDNDGWTALYWAIIANNTNLISMLILNGAKTNYSSAMGQKFMDAAETLYSHRRISEQAMRMIYLAQAKSGFSPNID